MGGPAATSRSLGGRVPHSNLRPPARAISAIAVSLAVSCALVLGAPARAAAPATKVGTTVASSVPLGSTAARSPSTTGASTRATGTTGPSASNGRQLVVGVLHTADGPLLAAL